MLDDALDTLIEFAMNLPLEIKPKDMFAEFEVA